MRGTLKKSEEQFVFMILQYVIAFYGYFRKTSACKSILILIPKQYFLNFIGDVKLMLCQHASKLLFVTVLI